MSAEPVEASLLAAASLAQANAHAPYSGFAVGAAVMSEDGRVFAGCNVENASYPIGTCAEAGAISAMVAAGGRRVTAALVLGPGPALVPPCGACRQRLREFADDDVPVHLATPGGIGRTERVGGLLPGAFGPDTLSSEDAP